MGGTAQSCRCGLERVRVGWSRVCARDACVWARARAQALSGCGRRRVPRARRRRRGAMLASAPFMHAWQRKYFILSFLLRAQAEKRRNAEMAVALRSVQRAHARPESPINKASRSRVTRLTAPAEGLGIVTCGGMIVIHGDLWDYMSRVVCCRSVRQPELSRRERSAAAAMRCRLAHVR